MKRQLSAFLLLSLATLSVGAAEPGIDVVATVTRYSEFELTERQTAILDEATKVSAAARVFHGLYGRWPNDVQELATRTTGIDFMLFDGKILLEADPEGLVVIVHDSKSVRRLLATANMPASSGMQERAQDSAFRIRITLKSAPPAGF